MNYIRQIKAFRAFKLSSALNTKAQVIYYNLLEINNELGWLEWFGATNARLMLDCGITNESVFINSRAMLIQRGLIDYKAGQKGSPSRYKIIKLYDETVDNSINTPVDK